MIYINFNGTDETIDMQLSEGDRIRVQSRWDDSWDAANRDFDLGIWDFADEQIVAGSALTFSKGTSATFHMNSW